MLHLRIRGMVLAALTVAGATCCAPRITADPQQTAGASPRVAPLAPIAWLDDKDAAGRRAKQTGRSILTLALPKPAATKRLDKAAELAVLRHPIVADVIDQLFVPHLVRRTEPRLSITTADGRTNSVSPPFTLARVSALAVDALKTTKRPIPPYLDLLHRETTARARGVDVAIFGMS